MMFNHNRYMEKWSETKKILLVSIFLTVFTISAIVLSGHTGWVFAAGDDNVSIVINISEVSSIDVYPDSLTWNATTPGADAGNYTLDVRNSGSLNLTNIWASVNTTSIETVNPTGQDSTYYASGGLIAIANNSNLSFHFVGRLEWNISYVPSGFTPTYPNASVNHSWGWFRNASMNYLWELTSNYSNSTPTGGMCNDSHTALNYSTGDDARTVAANGWTFTEDAGATGWGVGRFTSGPLADYCIAIHSSCQKLFLYKHDYSSTYPACSNRRYLRTTKLTPGSATLFNVRAWIPEGISRGNTTASTLTISAS